MSAPQPTGSTLTHEAILRALSSLSDELGKQRVTGGSSDVPDIVFLIRHLRLRSAAAALGIVAQYYPVGRIPVKTQYLVEGLFEEGKV